MLVTTEGIVLKQRKIAGNRRMITVFTRKYGKISAGTSINEKGKGKSALALRPFTYAEYDIFKTRESYSINSAQALKSFYSIGEDLDRFETASAFLEYMNDILEEGEARPKLFDLAVEFLESLSKAESNHKTLLYAFIIKTLFVQGVMPELKVCANCAKSYDRFEKKTPNDTDFFSVKAGGIICPECVEKEKKEGEILIFKPSFDIVTVVRYFIEKPISHFEKIVLKPNVSIELGNILSKYISWYLGTKVLEGEYFL